MIDAKTANRKSLINSKALTYMSNIETSINRAIEKGQMSATVHHNISDTYDGKQLAEAIEDNLIELGYTVKFTFSKPMPSGCPSDQWDFNNGYIAINWN